MTNVRVVNNYCFVNDEGVMVDITRRKRGRFYLKGMYADSWAFFLGNNNCLTSAVTKISSQGEEEQLIVTTQQNSYKLGNISPDYQEFLDATRRGITVVGNWNIYGSKQSGYYLVADIFPQQKWLSTSKIISQDGNFLTIRRLVEIPIGEQVWTEPEKIFVCWDCISRHALAEIKSRKKIADVSYLKFQKFNGTRCRPVLEI